ncbi:MAG: triphosphoribosyl-dephospho-CoA synthase CitG [Sporolactobacillus sp.]
MVTQLTIAQIINQSVLKALLYEISCFPSPGLVSPVSNGAHTDMNYYTFIDSTVAICPYFEKMIETGLDRTIADHTLLERIRPTGLLMEHNMFSATHNINTHKGMIFLMGVVATAAARTYTLSNDFDSIQDTIMAMTAGLTAKELVDHPNKKDLTYGEKIYNQYGITGIRGEVEKGIPSVFKYGLPYYVKHDYLPQNGRLVGTLLHIMAHCEDSTLLHRGTIKTLKSVQKDAAEAIYMGSVETKAGMDKIKKMDQKYSVRKISPGGSADLLSVVVFLEDVQRKLFQSQ